MKAAETLILWNGADRIWSPTDKSAPPGSIAIGPLETETCWWADHFHYECSGGAAYVERRKLFGLPQRHHVMLDYYQLVFSYGLHPFVVHRAFLLIDEYQRTIKDAGLGPEKDEFGHDPNVCFGRSVRTTVPVIRTHPIGPSRHFWPICDA